MRAAIRLLRSFVASRALALNVVLVGALMPSSSAAYWKLGQATGATPAEACENFAPQPQDPFLFVEIKTIYFGVVPYQDCKFIFKGTGDPSHASPTKCAPRAK